MKKFFKILIGLAILASGFAISGLLWVTRPKPLPSETTVNLTSVDFVTADFKAIAFDIPSQGVVESNQRSQIAAEVPGKVVTVNKQFEVGNTVPEGTILIELDPTDYEAAVAQANATLAEAKSMLASELARRDQARRDWERDSSRNRVPFDEAPELVKRDLQIGSADAKVKSAEAALLKAQKDQERTIIRAPYDAVIASKSTDKGNYLSPGTPIAEIFEANHYEVRLPVSLDELTHLRSDANGNPTGDVTLSAFTAGSDRTWKGKIIRSEGEVDRQTRSLYLIAEVDLPSTDGAVGVRPGLFMKASIVGKTNERVAALPFEAFTKLEEVQIIQTTRDSSLNSEEGEVVKHRLYPQEVNVIYRDKDFVYIDGGLNQGDKVCITEVPDLTRGHLVSVPSLDNNDAEPALQDNDSADLTDNTSATTKP